MTESAAGIVEEVEADSGVDSQDTHSDTGAGGTHKPEEEAVDVEALVATLQRHADKIPTDKLGFLDRKFQPEFTKRLNAFNALKENVDAGTRKAMVDAGVTVPEDLSIFDNDGKPFYEAIAKLVRQETAPIREQAAIGQRNAEIKGYLDIAREMFPEVNENYDDAIKVVDADPNLRSLAHAFDGKAVPYVLRGAAISVKLQKAEQVIADLVKENRELKVGSKVGTSSTKTGGKVINTTARKSVELRDIVSESLAKISAGDS